MATEQSSEDTAARLRTASVEGQSRPALDDPSARAAAASAVEKLIAGLQDGLDRSSADAYDRQFASDVLWGSPYGATVSGYEALNAVHHSLMAAGVAPASRYEIVQLMSPLPGVAIAQVRRNDLGDDKDQRFSEMAMYVLVERGGQWWLAAGQNTPIAERRA
jgi:uncharacterized protein (TIGR02246 family)